MDSLIHTTTDPDGTVRYEVVVSPKRLREMTPTEFEKFKRALKTIQNLVFPPEED